MIFANNVVYSERSDSITFANGSSGVAFGGNVVLGAVQGISDGFFFGNGLGDFVNTTWNASQMDAAPSFGSAIRDKGEVDHWVLFDMNLQLRSLPLDAGAFEGN
jgi:hypothetical protein